MDSEQALHQHAADLAHSSNFGGSDYLEGMRVLLRALDRDPQFTDSGRAAAYGTLLGTLTARLSAQQGLQTRTAPLPVIHRPVVITGIPRTGTTALHKMLSMDAQFQGLEHWLTDTPMTRPPRDTWAANPAFQACVAGLDAFFGAMPEMRKAHNMVADEVGECLDVLRLSFVSNRFGSSFYVPSYDDWFFAQSEITAYQRYALILRLIGANEPDKRWLLKNPGHIAQLNALLQVFPDAIIIQTHRDPIAAIPSLCSTLYMARRIFEGDNAQRAVIGPRECGYWSHALAQADRVRARHPHQFIDVDHWRFHADPMTTIHEIYAQAGLALSSATQSTMQSWIRAHPSGEHGAHRYGIDCWGISESAIQNRFSDYRAQRGFDQRRTIS